MSALSVRVVSSHRAVQLLAALTLVVFPVAASAQAPIIYPFAEVGNTYIGSGNVGVGAIGLSKFTVNGDVEIADGSSSAEYVPNGFDWTSADGHIGNSWVLGPVNGAPMYASIVTGNGFTGYAQRVQYGQGTDVMPPNAYGAIGVVVPTMVPTSTYIVTFKYRSNKSLQACLNAADTPVWVSANTGTAQKVTVLTAPSVNRNVLQFYLPGGGASASIGDWFEIDEVSIRLVNAGTLHAHGKGIFDGNVGIGTANPASKLSVVGDITATGVISGGNVQANYQDLAEWVPADADIPAGTVVVLDRQKPNHVVASSSEYDAAVAGVISAQPGIILGKASGDQVKVATTGRVKVHVDARQAAIRIGDLLVTSDRPGVAMKSQPVTVGGIAMHRPGTVIGKALEPLPAGEGDILVLLSLQ